METLNRQPKPIYSMSKMVMTLQKVKPWESGQYRCKIKSSKGIFNRTFDIPPIKRKYLERYSQGKTSVSHNSVQEWLVGGF